MYISEREVKYSGMIMIKMLWVILKIYAPESPEVWDLCFPAFDLKKVASDTHCRGK
jgi:hypothetical protein